MPKLIRIKFTSCKYFLVFWGVLLFRSYSFTPIDIFRMYLVDVEYLFFMTIDRSCLICLINLMHNYIYYIYDI